MKIQIEGNLWEAAALIIIGAVAWGFFDALADWLMRHWK